MVFTKRLETFYDDQNYPKQQRYLEKYLVYELLEMIERRPRVTNTMKNINRLILLRQ
jgi:hypothetical protein